MYVPVAALIYTHCSMYFESCDGLLLLLFVLFSHLRCSALFAEASRGLLSF